ncbi:MAG: S-methyl-5-thioribose-1-phosphate isomerase [Longimicrobiales bacterium]
MNVMDMPLPFETVRPTADGTALVVLDQTELPEREVERTLRTRDEMAEAIVKLRVRGAPLLGVVGARALAALATARVARAEVDSATALRAALDDDVRVLAATRPTAVNLGWALRRMAARAAHFAAHHPNAGAPDLAGDLRREAQAVHDEDRAMCRAIGEHGLELLPETGATVLTHCNAGALATGGLGTALSPLYLAHAAGRPLRVYADETRPLLQGSRLTAWELARAGIDVTVISDGMAGALFASQPVDAVFVGADRIAANGDVANKIGTYAVAVLARRHGVPFYVLAPSSTLDPACATGADIPIEVRDPDEIRNGMGRRTAPADAGVWNPAFDVTPAELVTAWITDRGVIRSWT